MGGGANPCLLPAPADREAGRALGQPLLPAHAERERVLSPGQTAEHAFPGSNFGSNSPLSNFGERFPSLSRKVVGTGVGSWELIGEAVAYKAGGVFHLRLGLRASGPQRRPNKAESRVEVK